MNQSGVAVFETLLGHCGIAWGERGLLGVQLPETSEAAARARLRRRFPSLPETSPPPDVRRAIDAILALLRGEPSDLSDVSLDMAAVPPFDRGVYEVTRAIAPGATLSYGEVAARLGERSLAREVGQALGRNPFPIVIPCHRVIAAGGKLGGFSAKGGAATKRRLLAVESALATRSLPLFADLATPVSPDRPA